MAIVLRGGKTPPRLLADLGLYNPQQLPASQYNVLTDVPASDPTGQIPVPVLVHKSACHHKWNLKTNQCSSTVGGEAPTGHVAAYCMLCRCHATIRLEYGADAGSRPCPQPGTPLHHLIAVSQASPGFRTTNTTRLDEWEDIRVFQCSMGGCPAKATVVLRSARLRPEWVELLVNQKLIDQRAEAAKATDPERFQGHANPPARDVLSNLKQYIANAMKGDERRINANNKKWMLALGDNCSELLHFLGFVRNEEDWSHPRPDANAQRPFENPLNILLDDVDKELTALTLKHCGSDSVAIKALPGQVLALEQFRELLGCKNCMAGQILMEDNSLQWPDTKKLGAEEIADIDEHPFFAGLGTVVDFHDTLIIFAYDQQLSADVENTPYYLECLQGIAAGRGSEQLQEKVVIESSLGKVSLLNIRDAYKQLNLDINEHLTEDYIIGMYDSRVPDVGKQQEAELKEALRTIGIHRHSERVKNHASGTIASYDQALTWLGATPDMDEDFIINMYGLKVNEDPSNEKLARKCIEVIAESRNSEALKAWLTSGELREFEMDPAQAYARLNVTDHTVDDQLIIAAYEVGISDARSQTEDLKRALKAIAKIRRTDELLNYVELNFGSGEVARTDGPLGIRNIGNTCYLNSLFQYFFSVTPVRDMVLEIEQFLMTLEAESVQKKSVGSRAVTRKEILRSQEFARQLKNLFQNMISARGPNISPEPQLARLTICPATQDLNQRRSSSVSTTRPLLNQPNELSPQKAVATAINIDATIPEGNEEAQVSPASDGTLVGDERRDMSQNPDYMVVDTSEGKKQTEALEDKENMPPTETAPSARSTNPENATQPLAPSSPSRVNEQPTSAPPQTEPNHKTNVLGDATDSSSSAGAPNRAPPVPPRSQEKDAVKQAEEYARQQDVTEVIGNVLFQLQCAIRPLGFDTDGQQQDEIKNLFFGMLKTTTTNSRGQARNKEEYFSDLMINVHSGPSDIYSAIDKALDRQIVTVDGSAETQFATISRLPPILQVYINRTDFDLKTSMPVKVTNHLDFPPEIYMDRFMDTDEADLLARRQQTWTYKDQLRQIETEIAALEKTKFEISQSEVFDTLAGQLMVIAECDEETDPAVYARMSAQSKQVAVNMREDLAKLRERAAELREIISSTYSDLKSIPYHLAAVFIHRGAASSGHYWIYIHDFQNDLWREYNDETVRVVGEPATTIFAAPPATERRPATPNYLVYVKAGMEQQLVQALRREPQQMLAEDAMQGVEQHPATDVPAWKDFDESWRGQSLIDDRGPTPEF